MKTLEFPLHIIQSRIPDWVVTASFFVAWSCGTLLSTPQQGATTPRNKVYALRLADNQSQPYDQVHENIHKQIKDL